MILNRPLQIKAFSVNNWMSKKSNSMPKKAVFLLEALKINAERNDETISLI